MQVKASIDEADIGKISQGAAVGFTVDAYPRDTFHGVIDEIRLQPETVQNVVTYDVMVRVANPDLKLKPGMTANLTAIVASRENVLTVPNAALRFTPAGANAPKAGAGTQNPSPAVRRANPNAQSKDRSMGTIWILDAEGNPHPASVHIGITDGVRTEVIDSEPGEGSAAPVEGSIVAVGSAQPSAVTTAKTPAATPSPFGVGAGRGRRGF